MPISLIPRALGCCRGGCANVEDVLELFWFKAAEVKGSLLLFIKLGCHNRNVCPRHTQGASKCTTLVDDKNTHTKTHCVSYIQSCVGVIMTRG